MARPIADTPVLRGMEAVRFMEEMERVNNLPRVSNSERRQSLEESYQWFKAHANFQL